MFRLYLTQQLKDEKYTGLKRIKFDSDHLDDVADAITRDNIRSLMTANTIKIKGITGTSRGRARLAKIQKRKRSVKQGSKKGTKGARGIGKNYKENENWKSF